MSTPIETIFTCPACQSTYDQGGLCERCTQVRQYVVLVREAVGPLRRLHEISPAIVPRVGVSGWPQIAASLNGGFPRGGVLLLSGSPGIGKSTLAVQLAEAATRETSEVLYCSTEFTLGALRQLGLRIGLDGPSFLAGYTTEWAEAEEWIWSRRPYLLVVDSVNGLRTESGKGRSSELVLVVERLVALARRQQTAMLLVCHETKEGEPAGPRTVEHLVDGLVTLERDETDPSVVWWTVMGKYRMGPVGRQARLVRHETGRLDEVGASCETIGS